MSYGGTYLEGATVRMQATFAVEGVNTDPTTVTLRVEAPDGTVVVYTYALTELTKSATGVYYRERQLSTPGTWVYRFEGTGTAAGVAESEIVVTESKVV